MTSVNEDQDVWIVVLGIAAVAAMNGIAYLAACAGAGRWLSIKEWLGTGR
jgi:hypothetical protein